MPAFPPIDPILSAAKIDPSGGLTVIAGSALAGAHVPPFPPDGPALIVGLEQAATLAAVKTALATVYPEGHPVRMLHGAGTAAQHTEDTTLDRITPGTRSNASLALYVPPLAEGASFEALQEVVAHLRAPNGCPWDREQTHLTLRKHLLEETYEALAALDSGDLVKMREEFGDLLLQTVMHAQIAGEDGEFRMADVIKGIRDKLVRRHPHVFGDVRVDGVADVLQNWEKLKADERKSGGEAEKSLLDGIPAALPGLSQAQEYQDRAARVGFDWPEIEGVLDKVREEIDEVREAADPVALNGELGDLLFALVNLSRWKKVDAESALRETNLKFKRRLAHVEAGARKQGRPVQDLSAAEMDALWEDAKRLGI